MRRVWYVMTMQMYLLDTDNMTLLERASPEAIRLKVRIATIPPDDLATTIVSYEEQMRGWLAVSAKARTQEMQIEAYQRLKRHLDIYCRIPVFGSTTTILALFRQPTAQSFRLERCHSENFVVATPISGFDAPCRVGGASSL